MADLPPAQLDALAAEISKRLLNLPPGAVVEKLTTDDLRILSEVVAAKVAKLISRQMVPTGATFLSIESVSTMIGGLSASWIWREISAGRFPAPVKLGARAVWRTAEVAAWTAEQGSEAAVGALGGGR